jgi:hypothetical protein
VWRDTPAAGMPRTTLAPQRTDERTRALGSALVTDDARACWQAHSRWASQPPKHAAARSPAGAHPPSDAAGTTALHITRERMRRPRCGTPHTAPATCARRCALWRRFFNCGAGTHARDAAAQGLPHARPTANDRRQTDPLAQPQGHPHARHQHGRRQQPPDNACTHKRINGACCAIQQAQMGHSTAQHSTAQHSTHMVQACNRCLCSELAKNTHACGCAHMRLQRSHARQGMHTARHAHTCTCTHQAPTRGACIAAVAAAA